DRRPTPMRPLGSGLEGASASLALLDDVHRHRLRRAALHLPLPSQERGPFQFSDRLLARTQASADPAAIASLTVAFENYQQLNCAIEPVDVCFNAKSPTGCRVLIRRIPM
ncbi:MAG: hypothetical protein ABSC60_13295, partial [Acidobacteriota bacterium]